MSKHLILLVDDVGVEGFRSYAKQESIPRFPRTPNWDRLEAAGVRFENAYVSPVCSPTRACLLTGRYNFRNGVGGNTSVSSAGPPDGNEPWLPLALAPMPCGTFGKWHLGSQSNGGIASPMPAPSGVAGFETHKGSIGNILSFAPFNFSYWHFPYYVDGVLTGTVGSDSTERIVANYNSTVIVDDALTWIAAQTGDWCCVVQFHAAHNPKHVPNTAAERDAVGESPSHTGRVETAIQAFIDGDSELLECIGWDDSTSAVATYIGMIEAMDYEIGRLLDHADVDIDLNSDVTIYAITDNGPSETSVEAPLDPDKAKSTVYSLGTKAPFVVAGEAVASSEAGKTCYRMAHIVDIYRTVMEAEGVDLAGDWPGVEFDGVDLAPVLADVSAAGNRAYSYTEIFTPSCLGGISDGATGATNDLSNPLITSWDRAVRSESYTLCAFQPTGPTGTTTYELYARKGGDTQNDTQLLVDQNLDFASVQALTAHYEGLEELVAALAGLLP